MKSKISPEIREYTYPSIDTEHIGEVPLYINGDERMNFLRETAHVHACSQLQMIVTHSESEKNLLPILIHKNLI